MGSTIPEHRRPGVVTFVGVVLVIQAIIAAAFAVVAFMERNNTEFQLVSGQTDTDLVVFAAVEGFFAILLFLIASGVLSGAQWARLVVAIVVAFRVFALSWWMIAHHAGGVHTAALVQIVIYVFVLWALYGHRESQEFYEGSI